VDPRRFEAPIFDGFRRHASWWNDALPPSFEAMNDALGAAIHPHSGAALRFVEQTPALLDDGLHYEERIFHHGQIATRAGTGTTCSTRWCGSITARSRPP
jgi:hypothetical protein